MDAAERMLRNSHNAFKDFVIFSTENELENIFKEIDFETLKKILRASKKIYDKNKNLSKKY
jgi:hypothetical protein